MVIEDFFGFNLVVVKISKYWFVDIINPFGLWTSRFASFIENS